MKRILLFSAFAFGFFVLLTAVTAVTPIAYESHGKWFSPPYDFSLRMTEIDCLKKGVNPFDVWHGDVVCPPYRPNYKSKVSGPEFTEPINAYAPWEYAMMMPLSHFPRRLAWAAYFLCMMACLFGVAHIGGKRGGAFAFLPLLGVAYPIWSNACIGNFSIFVLAATVGMAWSLEKKHDVLAAVCWAIAMLKPQLGVIFAIPLILRRKWIACAVAFGICVALSAIPAVLCHASLVTLIAQTPAANAFCFTGCGTWPHILCGLLGQNIEIGVALAIGALVCIACTLLFPRDCDWFVYLTPAAVCAMSWTYASTYGHVMGWFLFVAIIDALTHEPRSRFLWLLAFLSFVVSMRWFSVFRGLGILLSDRFPNLSMSQGLYYHLDTFSSTVDMAIMVALCLWISKRRKELCCAEHVAGMQKGWKNEKRDKG